MTQEDKELILKDICARLPYGVITKNCKNNFDVPSHMLPHLNGIKLLIAEYDLKPYLRPMSSMHRYEKEFILRCGYGGNHIPHEEIDFYNAHHLDYRGLIPKGLALEAPKDMYKF